jgi:hypothetical protein
MAAVQLKQSGTSPAIAEKDQVFAENPDSLRKIFKLVRDANWLPVAPHQLSHRRTRPHMREIDVLMRNGSTVRVLHRLASEAGRFC